VEGTEGRPGGDDSTGIPERVVEGGQLGTVGWVGKLRDEERSRVGREGQTETQEEASTDEHSDGLGGGLDDGTCQHDGSTEEDCSTTTKVIRAVRGEGVGTERANVLDGVQQAELSAGGVVEVVDPLRERLETVHHGTIITVGGGGDEEKNDAGIQFDEPGVLVPRTRVDEMSVADIGRL